MVYDIVIIGGGPSGLIAAIKAAEINRNLNISILEKNSRVGKKILSTGNGRCNLSNINMDSSHFHGDNLETFNKVYEKFDLGKTLDFFLSIGVLPYTNDEGKIFPNSLQASSVLDMLRFRAEELGIEIITEFNVVSVKCKGNFYISSDKSKSVVAKKIIVSTGGKAAPDMGSDGKGYDILSKFGHKLTSIYPALVQIKCPQKQVQPMKGVKVCANVKIYVDDIVQREESGEVLFTDYGLSGPPVFQISRIASVATSQNRKVEVELDIMPDISIDDLSKHILNRNKKILVDDFLTGLYNKQISKMLLKAAGLEKFGVSAQILKDSQLVEISTLSKHWRFDVIGTNSWNQAQTTAGGILTRDFNYDTLESNFQQGLYACGEVLDIDGDCGGYNLQWAWSSGAVAGMSAALSV